MHPMHIAYDPGADAIYVTLAAGDYARGKDVDDDRHVDYAADGTPIGVEFLNVYHGILLDDAIPGRPEIEKLIRQLGHVQILAA